MLSNIQNQPSTSKFALVQERRKFPDLAAPQCHFQRRRALLTYGLSSIDVEQFSSAGEGCPLVARQVAVFT